MRVKFNQSTLNARTQVFTPSFCWENWRRPCRTITAACLAANWTRCCAISLGSTSDVMSTASTSCRSRALDAALTPMASIERKVRVSPLELTLSLAFCRASSLSVLLLPLMEARGSFTDCKRHFSKGLKNKDQFYFLFYIPK